MDILGEADRGNEQAIRMGMVVVKDRDGNVQTSQETALGRWKDYFKELMNKENEG